MVGLEVPVPIIARILNNNGYSTGHFGKWHMGGQRDVDDELTDFELDVVSGGFHSRSTC